MIEHCYKAVQQKILTSFVVVVVRLIMRLHKYIIKSGVHGIILLYTIL